MGKKTKIISSPMFLQQQERKKQKQRKKNNFLYHAVERSPRCSQLSEISNAVAKASMKMGMTGLSSALVPHHHFLPSLVI